MGAKHLRSGLLAALVLAGANCTANTLPNGLQLARFEVRTADPPLVGSTATVEMTLKNLSQQPMRFDADIGIFVAARWNSVTNANNRDFGHAHKGLVLAPGQSVAIRASRTLDAAGEWRFWPGFKLGGNWGPFRWMEKTVQVPGGRAEGGAATSAPSVSQLLANAGRYDGKRVTVTGNALIVRKQSDSQGAPWTLMSLSDFDSGKTVMNVFGNGHAPVSNGDAVRVTGIFRVKSPRGRYTFDNEIQADAGGIVKDPSHAGAGNIRPDGLPIIDYRQIIPRPFNLGLLRGRLQAMRAEVQVRFQTRRYANRKATTGLGQAAIRVDAVERREQAAGPGSTPAGSGNTWLIVRLWLRGNPANSGDPEVFSQFLFGYDPAPVFFVADRSGNIYWPDSSWSRAVTYQAKSDKHVDDISTTNANWTRSALALKVPAAIQEPTLVVIAWLGGTNYEYTGVRLY